MYCGLVEAGECSTVKFTMGRTCAVLGCTNKKRSMSFHRFPTKDPVLRERLISVTGQRKFDINWMPNDNSRLCSDHFTTKHHVIRHNGRNSNPTSEVLTQPMPYQCSQCPAAFSFEHDLKEHKNISHQLVPFQCLQCPSVYSSENSVSGPKKRPPVAAPPWGHGAAAGGGCGSKIVSRSVSTSQILIENWSHMLSGARSDA